MMRGGRLCGFLGEVIFFLAACLLLRTPLGSANTEIYFSSLCNKGQFPTAMQRQIDAAMITSNNDKNLDCTVTFRAEYVSQKFLIRFEEFNMECGDRLYIYDSANAIGNHRAELTCRYLSPENIKPIRTRGHYVTLRFVADGWGTDQQKFNMIITSYKDSNQGCRDSFHCGQENICISPRLLCDSVNNCAGGEDEMRSANCSSNFLRDIFHLKNTEDTMLGIIVMVGLLVVTVVSISIFCLCKRRRVPTPQPRLNHVPMKPGPDPNGSQMTTLEKTRLGTLGSYTGKSENWDLPAESKGCNIVPGTLLRRLPLFIPN